MIILTISWIVLLILFILATIGVVQIYLWLASKIECVFCFLGGSITIIDDLWSNRHSEYSYQERFERNYHLGRLAASTLYYDKLMFLIWPLLLVGYLIAFIICLISLIFYIWFRMMELWGKIIFALLN